MNEIPQCPQCGARLSPEVSPEGLCPKCRLPRALPGDGRAEGDAETATASLSAAGPLIPGEPFGPYRVLRLLGEGGMGMVYLAEQEEPIRRQVALKVIKLGMDTKEVVARFESERQALAMMNHPNIARVFDAGASKQGRPYFVMEYVPGIPITEYCDRHRLSNPERLELFRQVCLAIHHAHQKGVIHRDIKPSNVLVAVQDGKPLPKVIDFGVAKATNQRLTEATIFTQQGFLIGTPEYMSPEQAEMSGLDVDTATDVYSLGVLLYVLLVGALPFDSKMLRRAGYDEIRRIIREEEPPRPTTRLDSLGPTAVEVAKHRRSDVVSLLKQLRGDLDSIVMKALEKDRTRRYASASELAADLVRHLSDEPVMARPPSAVYRLGKFLRKNKGPVAAVVAVVLSLMAGLSVSTALYFRAKSARDESERLRVLAQRVAYAANLTAADLHLRSSEVVEARRRLMFCEPGQRGWEWGHLYLATDSSLMRLEGGGGPGGPSHLTFSPDGRRIYSNLGKALQVLDAGTYKPIRTYNGYGRILAVAPDATRILSRLQEKGREPESRDLGVFEPASGTRVARLAVNEDITRAAFSPDGRRLVLAYWDGTLRVWDVASAKVIAAMDGHLHSVHCVAFSPDGRRVASGSADQTVRLWEASGKAITTLKGHEGGVQALAFSPDAARMVSGSADRTVRLWDTQSGKLIVALGGHAGAVSSVCFNHDGTRIVSGASDRTARLWDATSGEPIATLTGHESELTAVAFNPDGARILSAAPDGIRVWDAAMNQAFRVLDGHTSRVTAVAFSSDGKRLVSGSDDKTVRLWDVETGKAVLNMNAHESQVTSVAFSPDGGRIMTGSDDMTVRLWDALSGVTFRLLKHTAAISSVAFSPDGKRCAFASKDRTVHIFDASFGGSLGTMTFPGPVSSVVFSPDGTRIASVSHDNSVRLWDAISRAGLVTLRAHEGSGVLFSFSSSATRPVAFSPDGKRIACAAVNMGRGGPRPREARLIQPVERVQVWEATSGKPLAGMDGHDGLISSIAFSPDGRRIASASYDNTVRLWDAVSYELLLTLRGHKGPVLSVAFSPDGARIASGSGDKTIRIWESRAAR